MSKITISSKSLSDMITLYEDRLSELEEEINTLSKSYNFDKEMDDMYNYFNCESNCSIESTRNKAHIGEEDE